MAEQRKRTRKEIAADKLLIKGFLLQSLLDLGQVELEQLCTTLVENGARAKTWSFMRSYADASIDQRHLLAAYVARLVSFDNKQQVDDWQPLPGEDAF